MSYSDWFPPLSIVKEVYISLIQWAELVDIDRLPLKAGIYILCEGLARYLCEGCSRGSIGFGRCSISHDSTVAQHYPSH